MTVALSAVGLAVVLLGVPLGFAIHVNAVTQARSELERAALQAAGTVSPTFTQGDPVELPRSRSVDVGLYDVQGSRVTGRGPATLEPALQPALSGTISEGASDSAYL